MKLFHLNGITANIRPATHATSLFTARIMIVIGAWQSNVTNGRMINAEGIPEFATLCAHVQDSVGLPFSLPEVLDNPADIVAAYEIWLDMDPALWTPLLAAIDSPEPGFKMPHEVLQDAMEDWQCDITAGRIKPPKRGA